MIKLNIDVTPNVREFHTVGILKVLGTEYRANKKGTNYTYSEVEIEYPNGKKVIVDATTYENSVKVNKDRFVENAVVGLVVQIDGQFKGRTKLGLPSAREVDLSQFDLDLDSIIVPEGEEAPEAT